MTNRLLVGFLALTALLLAVLEIPLGISYARNERQDLTLKVERDAVTLASIAEDALEPDGSGDTAPLRRLAAAYAARDRRPGRGRPGGRPRASRHVAEFGEGRDFSTRPEFEQALARRRRDGRAPLRHARQEPPLRRRPGRVGRADPRRGARSRTRRRPSTTACGATGSCSPRSPAIVIAAAAIVGLALARWITRPLRDVERAAAAVGRGELEAARAGGGPARGARPRASSFNETAAKLQQLLHSQEAFVADASHQLRTPLTALRLRLENLERDVTARRPRLARRRAATEVERLARLVDGLLALARSDASEERAEPLDLAAGVRSRAEAWSALIDERGVRLETATDGPAWSGRRRAGVEQVLDNLLSNALEVSPPGGADPRDDAAATATRVELHVVDEGPGMPEAERARAFDRFWRSGGGEGSGLGLAIVQRLVGADGGEVELRAATPHGIDAVVLYRPA